jgi:UDP-N-acetylmuramyl pentapeptide phosphotransferase/UDP-N-acetylglucosamine-1-phosphate transferase
VAIVIVTVVAVAWSVFTGRAGLPAVAYLAGGCLIAAISWLDDLRTVPNRVRFLCHLVGACLLIAALWPGLPRLPLGVSWWLGAPLAALWIVAVTNIYNFMDGIDGLAGGQAFVAATWWTAFAVAAGMTGVATLALAVAAASAGFLLHNWAPARIFMGDVGSAFLGYTFAVLPLFALEERGRWVALLGGALALWPFLFDGTLTIVRRLLRGENIFRAHRSHLYQRLVIHGYSHAAVSLVYIAYAVFSALSAWVVAQSGGLAPIIVPLILGIGLFLWVSGVERRAQRRPVPRNS